jgi:hypothetical protein
MDLEEFRNEFNFKYDAASQGGPDIDDYEMSIVLTQAVRDLTEAALENFELNEESRRIVSHIIKYHDGAVVKISNLTPSLLKYTVSLPEKLMKIIREEPKLNNCIAVPEVVVSKLDEINTFLNNSFKKPTKRKVVKIENNKVLITVFSSEVLNAYRITYVKEIDPIIISDLDPGLSIEGLNKKQSTTLPAFIHSKIIDVAVFKAISIARTNNIQKQ